MPYRGEREGVEREANVGVLKRTTDKRVQNYNQNNERDSVVEGENNETKKRQMK